MSLALHCNIRHLLLQASGSFLANLYLQCTCYFISLLQCKEMCVEVQDNLLKEIRDLSEVGIGRIHARTHTHTHTPSDTYNFIFAVHIGYFCVNFRVWVFFSSEIISCMY